MNVNLEHVEALFKARSAINSTPLEDIIWHKNGKKIRVSKKDIKDFKFTGLSNIDFPEFCIKNEDEP